MLSSEPEDRLARSGSDGKPGHVSPTSALLLRSSSARSGRRVHVDGDADDQRGAGARERPAEHGHRRQRRHATETLEQRQRNLPETSRTVHRIGRSRCRQGRRILRLLGAMLSRAHRKRVRDRRRVQDADDDRALGASCEGAKCDVFFPGAFCSPSTKKCVVLERLSQARGGCVVSGEGATCGPGLYCRPQDPEDEGLPPGATARLGVCHSRHADGKACTSSIECRHHSECRSNVCVLAKPERPTCL